MSEKSFRWKIPPKLEARRENPRAQLRDAVYGSKRLLLCGNPDND
jgi:hypothetical protein